MRLLIRCSILRFRTDRLLSWVVDEASCVIWAVCKSTSRFANSLGLSRFLFFRLVATGLEDVGLIWAPSVDVGDAEIVDSAGEHKRIEAVASNGSCGVLA